MLGAPSVQYPGLLDILDYNSQYSLWVSAPPGVMTGQNNYYGGVYFTTLGSIEDFYKVTDPENPNFIIKAVTGSASPFSTASNPAYAARDLSIDNIPEEYATPDRIAKIYIEYPDSVTGEPVITQLKINPTGLQIVDEATGLIAVGSVIDGTTTGTKKLLIAGSTNIPTLDFDNDSDLDTYLTANASKIKVYWELFLFDEVIQTIYQLSPRSVPTTLKISKIDVTPTSGSEQNPNYNTVKFSVTELAYGNTYYSSGDLLASTDRDAKDGFGQSIYMENVLDSNLAVGGISYKEFTDATGTWPAATVTKTLAGVRVLENEDFDADDLAATLQQGWDAAKDNKYADVNVFFDPESVDDLKTTFAALRASWNKFSTFISGVKVASNSTETAVTQLQAARAALPNATGLAYYCNEFLVRETYNGTSFWSPAIGSIAAMLTRIMEVRRGGAAPMWTNVGNPAYGGQIERVVRKQKYKFTADHLDTLDAVGINPVVYDNFYGVMITSQRTAQSPINVTDWSYLGHSMAFDLFKSEIKQFVMSPQIGKPIDDFYMELRQTQAEAILNKRLVGETAIWDSGVVLVQSVNTEETKMARDFRIKIRVKVNVFSESVTLVFENVGQNTSVTQE